MKKILYNGNTLEMYSSLEEIPVGRFQIYNRFVLMDAGIGSDVNSVASHVSMIQGFARTQQFEKALLQLQNYHQLLHFVVSNVSPEMNSFYVLIHKINGKLNEDVSEEGISDQMKKLSKSGLTMGKVRGFLEWFKKKVESEFAGLFPKLSNTVDTRQSYDFLQVRTLLTLKAIQGEEVDKERKRLEKRVFDYIEPRQFSGEDGIEVSTILNFEDACLTLQQVLHVPEPKKMTVVAFYRALNKLQEMKKAG